MWGNLPAFGGQEAHHQSSNFLLKSTIVTRVGSEETPPEHPKREICSSKIQVKLQNQPCLSHHIINPSHQRVQRVLKSTLASGIRFMQESFSQPHARQDKSLSSLHRTIFTPAMCYINVKCGTQPLWPPPPCHPADLGEAFASHSTLYFFPQRATAFFLINAPWCLWSVFPFSLYHDQKDCCYRCCRTRRRCQVSLTLLL